MSQSAPAYTLPTWRALRWLTDPGVEVPQDIRIRLVSGFFTSVTPVLIGATVNTAVNGVAVTLHPTAPFVALLVVDVITASLRLLSLALSRQAVRRGQPTPTDFVLLCGLCWAGVVGVGTAMCLASGDPVLQFLAPTTMMGITSGIATRNSGAPRFAMTQIMLCDIPLQFALPFLGRPWMLLSVLQCPLFIFGMIATVNRLNQAYITVMIAEKESDRRASHDSLTGRLNRDGLTSALANGLRCAQQSIEDFALLYMDLDGFKSINDSYGHGAGDELLRQVADRISATLPETCCFGRFGGDEFIILGPGFDGASAAALGETVVAAIGQLFDIRPGIDVRIGISVGIACATPTTSAEDLLMIADAALYRAKSGGKGRCIIDTTRMRRELQAA